MYRMNESDVVQSYSSKMGAPHRQYRSFPANYRSILAGHFRIGNAESNHKSSHADSLAGIEAKRNIPAAARSERKRSKCVNKDPSTLKRARSVEK
jgi:hypothetical protein